MKALLKPLAKKPPKGPTMEAKEERAMLWIWNGYRRTVVCGNIGHVTSNLVETHNLGLTVLIRYCLVFTLGGYKTLYTVFQAVTGCKVSFSAVQ